MCLALSNDKFCKSVDTIRANGNVAAAEKESVSKSLNVKGGSTSERCVFCSKPGHRIYYCYSFIAASVEERCNFASSHNLCFSCLRSSHANKSRCPIRSSPRAANCKKDHHALLCSCKFEKSHSSETEQKTVGVPAKVVNLGVSCVSNGVGARLHVLPVVVSNENGEEREVYALLDSGSEETLLSKEISDFLEFPGIAADIVVITADGRRTPVSTNQVSFTVGPLSRSAKYKLSDVLVMTDLPSIGPNFPSEANLACHEHLLDLVGHFPKLHDDCLHLIIGAKETFISHFTRVRQAPARKPWAAKTKLGWVVYGSDNCLAEKSKKVRANFVRVTNEMLDRKLDLWLDTRFQESRHDDEVAMSFNDKRVLSVYEQSATRVGKHHAVALPFKKGEAPTVPNNFKPVERQFLSLARKLSKFPEQLGAYAKFMSDLFANNHAVVLSDGEIDGVAGHVWYLSHHMVHSSGKNRVVFNCSGEFNGSSINDLLLKGPTLANSLIGVFLRFRLHQYALVGDIKKMYYQCCVLKPFQDFFAFFVVQ